MWLFLGLIICLIVPRNPINKKRKITDDTKSGKLGSQNDKKQSNFADILESLQDDAEKSWWHSR